MGDKDKYIRLEEIQSVREIAEKGDEIGARLHIAAKRWKGSIPDTVKEKAFMALCSAFKGLSAFEWLMEPEDYEGFLDYFTGQMLDYVEHFEGSKAASEYADALGFDWK